MRKLLILPLLFCVAAPAAAGEIANIVLPAELEAHIAGLVEAWRLKPDDATGCSGGDCCPDTEENDQCTGSGAPFACCTGSATGTCNDEVCRKLAIQVVSNRDFFVEQVIAELPNDVDWLCSTWPTLGQVNSTTGVCTVLGPDSDVAEKLSKIARVTLQPDP